MEKAAKLAEVAKKTNWFDFLTMLKQKKGKIDFSKLAKDGKEYYQIVVVEVNLGYGTMKVQGETLADVAGNLQFALTETVKETSAMAEQLSLF